MASRKKPFLKLRNPNDADELAKRQCWRTSLGALSKEELIEAAISGAAFVEVLWQEVHDLSVQVDTARAARSKPGYKRHAATNKLKEDMRKVWEGDEWILRRTKRGAVRAFAEWVADFAEEHHKIEIDPDTVEQWTRDWRQPLVASIPLDPPPADVYRLLMYFRK